MKKFLRYLAAAVLTLCAVQAVAFAEAPVTVQLNGQNIVFTDAQPQIVNDRTFLPVRAVFEAMGAAVDFEDGVVTATRGGKTVSMTVGSTAATLTEDGAATALTMDVAPFIDPALGRSYVPVRFAAQALGANVGWDAAKRTVIIVDVEKQLENALAGKSFTYLEKFDEYSRKYNTGIWNSEVAAEGAMDIELGDLIGPGILFKLSVPFSVEAKGVAQDGEKVEVAEKITVDLSALKSLLLSSKEEADAETTAMVENMIKALSTDGVNVAVRGDLSAGKLYMSIDLSALGEELAGTLDADTWYVVDYSALGIDLAKLMAQAKNVDYKALAEDVLASTELNDAERDYAELDALLKTVVNSLSDGGFTKKGDVCTTSIEQEIGGIMCKLTLSLTVKNGAVAAYGLDMAVNGDIEDVGKLNWSIKMDVNEQDKISGSMTMNVMDMVEASFDLTGGYVKGGTAPQTEPPAGARLIDIADADSALSGLGG